MFDVDNTWIYGKNRQYETKFNDLDSETIPVISGITINNGINYYTKDKEIPVNEIFCDSLTISTRGEYSGTVTYHDGKFVLANNVLVMHLSKEWTKKAKIYFAVLVSKLGYGGFNNYPRKETLKNDVLSLPILPSLQGADCHEFDKSNSKNNAINFDLIETFIKAVQKECIKGVVLWQEEQRKAYEKVVSGAKNS